MAAINNTISAPSATGRRSDLARRVGCRAALDGAAIDPAAGPAPSTEAGFDRFSMEIARGCGEGCRFCQAGMVYRPVRERDPRAGATPLVWAARPTARRTNPSSSAASSRRP